MNTEDNTHDWDDVGERCMKCGDKDWFASLSCGGGKKVEYVPHPDEDYTPEERGCPELEPVRWFNGCDKTVPEALRYLANNDRPSGGESRFNWAHLLQLADEIETMARSPLYTSPQPVEQQPDEDVASQIIKLIDDECRYWHGRDEARRGGYAILYAKAKELNSKQQPAPGVAAMVEGMEVSVDVSTCDDDIGNRYFGTVTLAQPQKGSKHGMILLIQDAEPNFERKDPSVLVEALEQYADDRSWCYDTCNLGRTVAKDALAAYRKQGSGK